MAQLESFQTAATHIDVVRTSSGGGGWKGGSAPMFLEWETMSFTNTFILLYINIKDVLLGLFIFTFRHNFS